MRKPAKKNIFADKATFILRKMLQDPDKKWVVRDFTRTGEVSLGLAQEVLETMDIEGYVERVKKGPESYTVLTEAGRLLDSWLQAYNFEMNEVETYYTHEKDVLKRLKSILMEDQYALTLHTGANILTSFVKDDNVYLYLNTPSWDKDVLEIRQRLDLKELVRGGNMHFIRPRYKGSVFFNARTVKGYRVVAPLQLFLDLYHFQPRGQEHAEYLKTHLEDKGKDLGRS
jgi:hypothetical protein